MKKYFHSKDHKKEKSLKLQQQLQLQEEKLWKAEMQRRRQQELLDEEMAKKLQEELEANGEQSQPQPPTAQEQELTDEELARRLQAEFEAEERQRQQQQQQEPSPPPEPVRQQQQPSPPSPPALSRAPPPLPSKPSAYNQQSSSSLRGNTSQAQSSSNYPATSSPSSSSSSSIPRPSSAQHPGLGREVPPPPYASSSSSSTNVYHTNVATTPPAMPARDYNTSTPSPQQHVPPSPVRTPAPGYPTQNNNNNNSNASPPSPMPLAAHQPSYPPVVTPQQQQGYPQQHAFANTAPPAPSSPSASYRPQTTTGYPPPPQPSQQTAAAPYPPSSPPQQQQQHTPSSPSSNYPYPSSQPQSIPPQSQHNYAQHAHHQQQQSYSHYHQHQPSEQQQQQQQQQQQPYPAQQHQDRPAQSMGAALFGSSASLPTRKEPMMFVVPPVPEQQQQRQQENSTPVNQYMPMPVPPVIHRASSPAAASTQYSNDHKPSDSGIATHVSPLSSSTNSSSKRNNNNSPYDRTHSPAPILKSTMQKPHETPVSEYRRTSNDDAEEDEEEEEEEEEEEDYVMYKRKSSSTDRATKKNSETLRPTNVNKKGKGHRRRGVKKSNDESDPFADSFAIVPSATEESSSSSSSSSEEEESESETEESEEEEPVKPIKKKTKKKNRTPPPPVNNKKKSKSKKKKRVVEEDEEEEEEEEEVAVKPKAKEPEFNPAEYFDDADLVDLNAPSDYDTSDDGSSADEDHVEEVKNEAKTKKAKESPKPTEGHLLDIDIPEEEPKKETLQQARTTVIEPKLPITNTTLSHSELKKIDTKTTPKKPAAPARATATRVDPTFSSLASLAPIKKVDSNKSDSNKIEPIPPWLERQESSNSDVPSPSVSVMQARLAGILVNDDDDDEGNDDEGEDDDDKPRSKGDKTQETIDAPSRHTPTPSPHHAAMYNHQRSRSTGALMPQDAHGSTVPYHQQLQHTPYVGHASYDDMAYMTPQVYPANVLRAGAPPGVVVSDTDAATTVAGTPVPGAHSLYNYPNVSMSEVPSNEYGYYKVDPEASGTSGNAQNNDDSDAKSNLNRTEKALPKIPKIDPNHRHITVPSVNPGQRVWIRVNPTDTGKSLAQRIHIVATYKSRKILAIKTANGRDIPIDDTAVFDDWTEIEKLEDGAPWEVEWGPLDHSFIGGRQLMKQLKAGLRAAVKEQ